MRLSASASRAFRRMESTATTTCARRSFTSGQHQPQEHIPSSRAFSQLRPRSQTDSHNHNHGIRTSAMTIQPVRTFHTTPSLPKQKLAHNNEPIPTEAPQTSFSQMDMLAQTPVPSTSIDVCAHDGFTFNSGAIISHGDGALLVGGEAFAWRPWEVAPVLNSKGQFELSRESLALFESIWPRPDLLIVGMGKEIRPLSKETREIISALGMRVDVLDTRNAASQFNLLATERGVDDVAAVLVPLGWKP
ncbi:Protein of unknown function (DUF498/DUF598) domain containing protein [Naviculisporaceae sp. PSN 640]